MIRLPAPLVLLALLATIAACSSREVENSNPVDSLDGVSFSADVAPLLSASCAGSGCHVGQTTSGVNLTTHAQILASTGIQYGTAVVVPGDAEASPLVDKLGPNPDHGSRMPLGRPALSAAQIEVLKSWIDAGALND